MSAFDQDLADRAGTLVASLGLDGFEGTLAGLLASVADFQQVIVFAVPRGGAARCLYGWHRSAPGLVTGLARRYVEGGFATLDPTLRQLQQTAGPPRKLRLLSRGDIDDATYRSHFFDRPGLDRKMSILNEDSAQALYLNFYKRLGTEDFSEREIGNLAGLSGLVGQSILRHHALVRDRVPVASTPKLDTLHRLIAGRQAGLSARELDVCVRIVAGYSTEAIALHLGVAENSVATYRKRAYAKLGISSKHELFGLCLSAMSGFTP